MSIRDTIFAASDRDVELVDVPEWGVKLELRSPSGEDRGRLMTQTVDPGTGKAKEDWTLLWPLALIACAHDPDTHERVFSWEDIGQLNGEKSALVLARLGDKCLGLAGLKEDSLDAATKSPASGS